MPVKESTKENEEKLDMVGRREIGVKSAHAIYSLYRESRTIRAEFQHTSISDIVVVCPSRRTMHTGSSIQTYKAILESG